MKQPSKNSVGILGSGPVGRVLAKGFIETGNTVSLGTRHPSKPELQELKALGLHIGSFDEVANASEILVIATLWSGTHNMLILAGEENFAGKLVIDVTNPLDFSKGPLPAPAVDFPNSAAKTIQAWIPKAKVVKALNIISNTRMFKPHFEDGAPVMFICGNDPASKSTVADILHKFGWADVQDLGSLDNAYLLEGLALLWITQGMISNNWKHGFALLKS
jgi:8-hydroxy-5-deazaflavin:NADPH oxidoreductase